jgi:lipopolysaccharide/colanic/teichoic acid biosynthesis glycosyltransferase
MTWRKRVFDIVVGSVLALAAIPVVAILAVGVVLSLRSSPFFLQRRVGLHGRTFSLLKLRTLPPTVSASHDKYALAGVDTTRFCRFLRASHLDELPQLLHVPLGTMSLVGPRPEMPELLARFDPEFVEARQGVRPGCTGLWQISPDADRLINEAPHHDLDYLARSSLGVDLRILAITLRLMVLGRPPSSVDGTLGEPTERRSPTPVPPAGVVHPEGAGPAADGSQDRQLNRAKARRSHGIPLTSEAG